jgi:HEAT repeat protein
MNTKLPQTLVEQFCAAAAQHADATENGRYKRGNKAYAHIIDALQQLKAQQSIGLLKPLLQSPNLGIRVWTASCLLHQNAPEAEATLLEVAKLQGIQAFNAETTLQEWRAGRLPPLF